MQWNWSPHPGPQTTFFTHSADIVGYGGSAGSGKSAALRAHHLYIVDFEDQRWRRGEIVKSSAWCIYLRRTMPMVRQVEDEILRTFPAVDPDGKWNANDHVWSWPCGVKFMLGGMEKAHDYLKYYGWEFIEIDWDELTEFEEEQFDQLETRKRTSDPALKQFLNTRWGSNPVGPGLLWVRRRFVEPYRELGLDVGTTIRIQTPIGDGGVIKKDQVFIQAYLSDNPSLAGDGIYEANLRSNKPHIAKALLEGNWYFSAGGFLSEYWNEEFHVCDNHEIPPNVFRFRSCDFGINEPTSITWWYVDNDRCMTAYHNLYVKNLTADQISARVREIEIHYGDWDDENHRSMLRRSPLDAQCFKRSGTSGPTVAEEFRRHGVPWIPSSKDRFNGLAEVVRRLNQYIDRETGELVDARRAKPEKCKPLLRYMRRCEAPRRILPVIPADPTNPGDVPRHSEDHVLDDLMYSVMSYPLRPRLQSVPDHDDYDEEKTWSRQWHRKAGLGRLVGQR